MRELQIDHHQQGVESEQRGGKAEDGLLTVALGGFQLQGLAAFLKRAFDGPPLCGILHHLLRLMVMFVVKKYSPRWVPVPS
jgi:hypothetical protein